MVSEDTAVPRLHELRERASAAQKAMTGGKAFLALCFAAIVGSLIAGFVWLPSIGHVGNGEDAPNMLCIFFFVLGLVGLVRFTIERKARETKLLDELRALDLECSACHVKLVADEAAKVAKAPAQKRLFPSIAERVNWSLEHARCKSCNVEWTL